LDDNSRAGADVTLCYGLRTRAASRASRAVKEEDEPMSNGTASPVFRQEAVDHHLGYRADGRLIRLSPGWTRWSYWLLAWSVAAALAYAIVGNVNQYATGPAVVRIDGRTELTAPMAGTVAEVRVRPGDSVHEGDELVQFYLAEEKADLDRAQREHDGLMLRVLRDPGDQPARAGLNALQAQRDLALQRIAQRSVLAPHDGIIRDVRVRLGQALLPGEALMTVTRADSAGYVIGIVPAQTRPMLETGMTMRLELTGFRFAYQELRIDAVGDEAVGPNEVKRFLGSASADTVAVTGPVVLVRAALPSRDFTASGQYFQFYDGMVGAADVRLRSESLLVALIPGLRDLFTRPPRG
jgi:membrane fusion protein (multidrug efflux system)